jgi:hypothetical protein
MSEYIVRETDCGLATKQEIVGELVRCKDCVFSKPYNEKWIQPKMLNNDRWCELYGTRHQNWYCADGERRTNETD